MKKSVNIIMHTLAIMMLLLIIVAGFSIPIARATGGRVGAIVIDGDSMYESIPFGAVVVCLPLTVHDGDIVIAQTKQAGLVVKRLSNGSLISENPFGMRFAQGDFTIMSRVLFVVYFPMYRPRGSVAAERVAAHAHLKKQVAEEQHVTMSADIRRIRKPEANELDLRQVIREGGQVSAFGTVDPTLAVDDDPRTFWAPALSGDSWWQLKLDKPRRVVVDFGCSSGLDDVRIGLDGHNWTQIKVAHATSPVRLKYLRIWGKQDGDLHLNLPLNITEVKVTPRD